jgi:hypothetical protein
MRLSLAAPVMTSLLPAAQAQAESIRLAAWNINNLNDVAGVALRDRAPIRAEGDYDLLNQYRAQLNPDVVALQEMGNPKAAARIFPPDEYEVIFGALSAWSARRCLYRSCRPPQEQGQDH